MKKILGIALVMVFVLSAASFAAKASSGDAGKLGYGMFFVTPTVRYNFSDSLSGQLGANNAILTVPFAGTTAVLGALSWKIMEVGQNSITSGVLVNYLSIAGASATTISWIVGVETKLNPNLVVGAEILPISNTTPTGILSGAALTAHLYL